MEEQERAMEEDALDSKPPLTTEEDEPKHTVLHGSHITETQQEPREPAPEENETKPQFSELLVINSLAPPDSWEPVHTDIKLEELTKTEMLILSQTENQAAIQTQDQTETLSQTDEFIILDQNGQPLQCERMVLVTSQSDNGEMYVIPSNQLGGAQVLLPRGHLLDIIDPTGSCGEKTADEKELHTITLTAVTDDSGSLTTVPSAVTDDSGSLTTVPSAVTDDSGSLTTVPSAVTDDSGSLTTVPSAVTDDRGSLTTVPSAVTDDRGSLTTVPSAVTDDRGSLTTVPSAVTDDSGSLTIVTSAVTDDRGSLTTVPSAVTDDSGSLTTVPSAVTDDSGSLTIVTSAVTDDSGSLTTVPSAVTDDSGSLTTVPSAAAKSSAQSSQVCFTSLKPLPANAPNWALRLHNAEKIGDSYRGYCNTDTELETILLLHKQQTNSVFGTRQSPSPAKPASRLMWKSQYVPYDGVPFVNAGSRAIVMECQYGPRRKGLQPKKAAEQNISPNIDYKATCPARIYIKKVCKFPQHRVPTDPNVDKRVVRQEQEKAFFNLRKTLWDVGGVLRYYLQLPTQKAHLYHDMEALLLPPPPDLLFLPMEEEVKQEEEEERGCVCDEGAEDGGTMPSRLHPRVAEKIRELVEQGYHQVYQVRKQLRRFVEREMFKSEEVPERHNLCYFPTVNDIKNHIHEAQKTFQQAGGGTTDITQVTRKTFLQAGGAPLI
ncbi:calcium-responsive transcription factor isoform X2 [Oncorhynchus tshawytscha]|uniref:calcium-responsive transcription factor isoform X2 n=1 Tax=Oncorhynchus tshawytscha TaxID=74940 RepID=UPI001C3D7993|nr:calcium-responsive transcription factor isoform X2 [Oncorhynchus tshawytscha]